jgi:hypothetical protein
MLRNASECNLCSVDSVQPVPCSISPECPGAASEQSSGACWKKLGVRHAKEHSFPKIRRTAVLYLKFPGSWGRA